MVTDENMCIGYVLNSRAVENFLVKEYLAELESLSKGAKQSRSYYRRCMMTKGDERVALEVSFVTCSMDESGIVRCEAPAEVPPRVWTFPRSGWGKASSTFSMPCGIGEKAARSAFSPKVSN